MAGQAKKCLECGVKAATAVRKEGGVLHWRCGFCQAKWTETE